MKSIKYTSFFAALLLVFLISCEKDDYQELQVPEIQATGLWNVAAYIDDAAVTVPFQLEITDAVSPGGDSIVIKDTASDFWSFQVKVAKNGLKGIFGTKLSNCEISDPSIGIKIANGKIIQSDSIYFEIQFEDDQTPFGTTYQIKGGRVKE